MKKLPKKISVKKALGVKGSFVIDFIAIYAVVSDPELVKVILWPLMIYYAGLFGIKMLNMLKAKFAHSAGEEE